MPLTLTLNHHGEQLVAQHLRTGRYRSPEELVTCALENLTEQQNLPQSSEKKPPAEAVAHIRQSRKAVNLGGLKIKDLIHAGHKY